MHPNNNEMLSGLQEVMRESAIYMLAKSNNLCYEETMDYLKSSLYSKLTSNIDWFLDYMLYKYEVKGFTDILQGDFLDNLVRRAAPEIIVPEVAAVSYWAPLQKHYIDFPANQPDTVKVYASTSMTWRLFAAYHTLFELWKVANHRDAEHSFRAAKHIQWSYYERCLSKASITIGPNVMDGRGSYSMKYFCEHILYSRERYPQEENVSLEAQVAALAIWIETDSLICSKRIDVRQLWRKMGIDYHASSADYALELCYVSYIILKLNLDSEADASSIRAIASRIEDLDNEATLFMRTMSKLL